MSGPLSLIARIMRGDVCRGGWQANIPAPGHSRHDRSVSLGVRDDGRILINVFSTKGQVCWKDVRNDLQSRGLIDADGKLSGWDGMPMREMSEFVDNRQRRQRAMELWNLGRNTARTLAETYARSRAITDPLPDHSFRFLGQTPVAPYKPNARLFKPALLTAIRKPGGELTAIEITYLTMGGQRDYTLYISRKMIGEFDIGSGASVHIDDLAEELLVAEGAFTTLHARKRFGLPARALLSTGNMRGWTPPPGVRRLVIARDNGKDGEASANKLAHRARDAGLNVEIEPPPVEFDDFDTWGRDDAMKALADAIKPDNLAA